jgi:hypothetical protein
MKRMFVIALVALVVAGCAGNDLSTPEGAVRSSIQAISAQDSDATMKCLSAYDRAAAGKSDNTRPTPAHDGEFVVGAAAISEDEATVPVTYKDAGGRTLWTSNWHCVLENGEWKLALARTVLAFQLENFRYVQAMDAAGDNARLFPPTWDAEAVLRSAPMTTASQPRSQPPAEMAPVIERPHITRPAD